MKLSELINKFDNLDKVEQAAGKQVLTKDQAFIFRDIFSRYQAEGYAVLDAKSGSGKTTLIKAMMKYAEANKINITVTASTGKAASALDGQTIHSYLGLKMVQNNDATVKEDALVLASNISDEVIMPDILIIDEASMIGQKVFRAIDNAHFPFVLFVLDSSQLPPVKEKKVEWQHITPIQYTLTKTLRAKDPRLMKLFSDFREYRDGIVEELSLNDYVNGDNIVAIDFNDVDYIPANSECCSIGYRNKLVDFLVDNITADGHNMYNLNGGVSETLMVATEDTLMDNGYFKREFKQHYIFANGEDVSIEMMNEQTNLLISKGYCYHNGHKLTLNKKRTGIRISAHEDFMWADGAREPIEDMKWLNLPDNEILERSTLACINKGCYVFLWDGTEEEYDELLEAYFKPLAPHLSIERTIKAYFKDRTTNILKLPYQIQEKMKASSRAEFNEWFKSSEETVSRKKRWSAFLNAKSVVSVRKTTSRTIHKSQGISVPAVIITDQSFYGASLSAQYVAVTRMKQGLILVYNTPTTWRDKEEEDYFE